MCTQKDNPYLEFLPLALSPIKMKPDFLKLNDNDSSEADMTSRAILESPVASREHLSMLMDDYKTINIGDRIKKLQHLDVLFQANSKTLLSQNEKTELLASLWEHEKIFNEIFDLRLPECSKSDRLQYVYPLLKEIMTQQKLCEESGIGRVELSLPWNPVMSCPTAVMNACRMECLAKELLVGQEKEAYDFTEMFVKYNAFDLTSYSKGEDLVLRDNGPTLLTNLGTVDEQCNYLNPMGHNENTKSLANTPMVEFFNKSVSGVNEEEETVSGVNEEEISKLLTIDKMPTEVEKIIHVTNELTIPGGVKPIIRAKDLYITPTEVENVICAKDRLKIDTRREIRNVCSLPELQSVNATSNSGWENTDTVLCSEHQTLTTISCSEHQLPSCSEQQLLIENSKPEKLMINSYSEPRTMNTKISQPRTMNTKISEPRTKNTNSHPVRRTTNSKLTSELQSINTNLCSEHRTNNTNTGLEHQIMNSNSCLERLTVKAKLSSSRQIMNTNSSSQYQTTNQNSSSQYKTMKLNSCSQHQTMNTSSCSQYQAMNTNSNSQYQTMNTNESSRSWINSTVKIEDAEVKVPTLNSTRNTQEDAHNDYCCERPVQEQFSSELQVEVDDDMSQRYAWKRTKNDLANETSDSLDDFMFLRALNPVKATNVPVKPTTCQVTANEQLTEDLPPSVTTHVEVTFSGEFEKAFKVLDSFVEPYVANLIRSGDLPKQFVLSTFSADNIRFLVKQEEKEMWDKQITDGGTYKMLLIVCAVVMATDLLLRCCLESAIGHLAAVQEKHKDMIHNALDGVRKDLFRLKMTFDQEKFMHPKIAMLCRTIENNLKVTESKVLVVVKRMLPSLLNYLEQSLSMGLLIRPHLVQDLEDDPQLERHNCIIIGDNRISSDFPWMMFTNVIEFESTIASDVSRICMEERVDYMGFTDAAYICESKLNYNTTCGDLTEAEVTIISNKDLNGDQNLLDLLESRHNMSIIHRHLQAACLPSPYADIIIDECNCIVLHALEDIIESWHVEILSRKLVVMGTQFSKCWVIFHSRASSTQSSYILTSSVLANICKVEADLSNSQANAQKFQISYKVLIAYNSDQLARLIRSCSDACKDGISEEWKRKWISTESSKSENSLTSYPCLNSFTAQLLLSRSNLQALLTATLKQLTEIAPEIPEKVMLVFHKLVHSQHGKQTFVVENKELYKPVYNVSKERTGVLSNKRAASLHENPSRALRDGSADEKSAVSQDERSEALRYKRAVSLHDKQNKALQDPTAESSRDRRSRLLQDNRGSLANRNCDPSEKSIDSMSGQWEPLYNDEGPEHLYSINVEYNRQRRSELMEHLYTDEGQYSSNDYQGSDQTRKGGNNKLDQICNDSGSTVSQYQQIENDFNNGRREQLNDKQLLHFNNEIQGKSSLQYSQIVQDQAIGLTTTRFVRDKRFNKPNEFALAEMEHNLLYDRYHEDTTIADFDLVEEEFDDSLNLSNDRDTFLHEEHESENTQFHARTETRNMSDEISQQEFNEHESYSLKLHRRMTLAFLQSKKTSTRNELNNYSDAQQQSNYFGRRHDIVNCARPYQNRDDHMNSLQPVKVDNKSQDRSTGYMYRSGYSSVPLGANTPFSRHLSTKSPVQPVSVGFAQPVPRSQPQESTRKGRVNRRVWSTDENSPPMDLEPDDRLSEEEEYQFKHQAQIPSRSNLSTIQTRGKAHFQGFHNSFPNKRKKLTYRPLPGSLSGQTVLSFK